MADEMHNADTVPDRSDSPANSSQEIHDMGHDHIFIKKTFHKPTYCHHCTDMLWGLIQQGYVCEDYLNPRGAAVVGGKLVITDYHARAISIYRRYEGMLLYFKGNDTLQLLSSASFRGISPNGVCCINDAHFCVANNEGSIKVWAIQCSRAFFGVETFDLRPFFHYCHGVALWNKNIVVSGRKGDRIYWSVMSLRNREPGNVHEVCTGKFSCLTVNQDMVYITCYADAADDTGVYGFNLHSGALNYTYQHNELLQPRGITVDDIGHLFVCDGNSSIHHLTGTCQLVAIYRDGIPRDASAIFWDHGFLYLTCTNSDVITMYETPRQGN